MLSPVRIELEPLVNLWFEVQQSPVWANLTCSTYHMGSLKSYLCITWFLDLDDLVRIIEHNYIYKEPKVSVLQGA